MKDKKYCQKIRQEKGSITLYVLISMFFFITVVLGIYFNSTSKVQKQNKEIEKIQKEYEKENINDIYEKTYNKYLENNNNNSLS